MKKRNAFYKRKTRETDIKIRLSLDGSGTARNHTGIGFLDHMLDLLAKHAKFDLEVKASGDLKVDKHHTNEDVGLSLGRALSAALGSKTKIRRYGFFYVPMGEALARVCLDLSGRPSFFLNSCVKLSAKGESYRIEDAEHFLESFAQTAGINIHVDILAGKDTHHVIEAVFKALARALDQATQIDPRERGIPSTKGTLCR